jgi:elongin-A
VPYQYLPAILKAVKTPAQLHELELNSDDIYDETEASWKRFIQKDFRALSAQHNYVPNNRKSWHKVYDRYKKLTEAQIAAATEKMMQDFAARDQQMHSRTSTIISCEKSNRLRPSKVKPGFAPPREKNTLFRKVKKEVRLEASRFNLRTPTGKLHVPSGQVKSAPKSKLEEVRIASQPSFLEAQSIRPARLRGSVKSFADREHEMREARLLRIKNSNKPTTGNLLAFSDDENASEVDDRTAVLGGNKDAVIDDLEQEENNLFGDHIVKGTVSPASPASRAVSVSPPPTIRLAKRPRDAPEPASEPPAKRQRQTEASGVTQAPNKRRWLSSAPTKAASPPNKNPALRTPPSNTQPKQPATTTRPKALPTKKNKGEHRAPLLTPVQSSAGFTATRRPVAHGTPGCMIMRMPSPPKSTTPVNDDTPPRQALSDTAVSAGSVGPRQEREDTRRQAR